MHGIRKTDRHAQTQLGLGRTLMDGIDGAAIWCAWGITAHASFTIPYLATNTTKGGQHDGTTITPIPSARIRTTNRTTP